MQAMRAHEDSHKQYAPVHYLLTITHTHFSRQLKRIKFPTMRMPNTLLSDHDTKPTHAGHQGA